MANVLIVESQREVAAAAEALLAAAGCRTRSVGRAEQAADAAREFAPELILIDLDAFGAGLGELLASLREAAPQARFAALTSSSDAGVLERARALGLERFILKGPGIVSFRRTLLRCVDGEGLGPAGRRPRVLVVDDEESIRKVLKRFLEGKGYEVETAEDGAQALQAVKYFKPAAVLLDINMPVMDGVAALRELVRLHPALGVIMVTANEDEERARECMRLGAADYISKPFDLDSLEASLMVKLFLS